MNKPLVFQVRSHHFYLFYDFNIYFFVLASTLSGSYLSGSCLLLQLVCEERNQSDLYFKGFQTASIDSYVKIRQHKPLKLNVEIYM